ncbi:MAG: PQQ-dependent dehydrogenase, methanol/ethanol family, partial [Sphingomonadaceae bacterium]|nr:PQQ-dependent dehydrogenase, methanol/ethanol family [Sphingomonadaceae bacterium]
MKRLGTVYGLALWASALGSCGQQTQTTSGQPLAATADADWNRHGRDLGEQRYSPLTAISDVNVSKLKLAWYFDLDTNRGQEATPIVANGIMYTTSAWSKVQAFDAATGKLLWQFDPQVPGETGVKGCCDVVNRGVAVENGKVFFGTFDGRLIALDAKSGKTIWSVVTVDQSQSYTITGAPRLVPGKVLIGNGGAEYGVRGYVSAYDMETGKLAWRFYTVPGKRGQKDGAPSDKVFADLAGKSWIGKPDDVGGGGTVWDSMAYDPELDLLYIGVGNGSPWNIGIRSPGGGDNLFLSSIIALRPQTGEYVWHYQTTPGDQWDYTATQHMILADLQIGGQMRKVLIQAPKNGYFYVLDRTNGTLLSADPFVPVTWSKGVDPETGRPNVVPEAYYHKTVKPWIATPGFLGGHNWHPMAFSPKTGLVYVPAQEIGSPYIADTNFSWRKQSVNMGVDLEKMGLPADRKIVEAVKAGLKGRITAWDPIRRREAWRVELGGPWNGGMLATAGNLLFQGTAAGSFNAYDTRNGRKLWSFDAQSGIVAPPIPYAIGGKQYVSVVVGWGGIYPLLLGELAKKSNDRPNRSRVLTFSLDGAAQLPKLPAPARSKFTPPAPFGAPEQIAAGRTAYARSCSGCHGDGVRSGGVLPDLRHSTA